MAAVAQFGWRVYATNRPAAGWDAIQVVLAYRDQYLVEHPIGRLKGAPLSLSLVSLSREAHVCGLVRLLTIAVRVLSLLEYGICQPSACWRRSATMVMVALPTQVIRHLTPLSALQHRLLALAGLDESCYTRLTVHSSEPPG